MSQQGQNDASMDSLWIAGILIALFIVAKVWLGEEIAWVYTHIRLAWIQVITLFWEKDNLMLAKHMLLTRKVSELSPEQLSMLSKDLRFFMYPFWAGIVGLIGYRAIKHNPGKRFRRRLTRQDLAKEMSEFFPWTIPALQQNLLEEPIDSGKWAMAKNPLQFAREYGLLNGKSLDEKRADKLFALQLGKLWSGPDRLNKYSKAVFGCLIAQVCQDKDGADGAQRELAINVSRGNPKFTLSDALIAKHRNDPRVLDICARHAYQYTVMMALFEEGKAIGIFPPNHFLWVKPVNRQLWFVLDCVLRKTYYAEVAGIYAHFLAEKVCGHKIEFPYTKKATLALDIALRDVVFTADK